MEHINTFIGGMDKDTSKKLIKPNCMIHSENFQLVTDEKGATNGAIVTPRGNKYLLTIPSSPGIIKYEKGTVEPVGPWTYTININGLYGLQVLSISSATDGWDELFDKLYTEFTTNGNFTWLNVIRVSPHEIVIWSDDLISSSQDASNYDIRTQLATKQVKLQPIGSTYIRDDIYVFTTNDTTVTGGEGQIWKLNYDEETLSATIEMVFAGRLNFSLKHPIQAVGRYENSEILRLYWTDDYNFPRTMNVADENIMFSNLEMFNMKPSIAFSRPLLKSVETGGSLKAGMYQLAYRMKKDGYITQFCFPTNKIHVVSGSETSSPYFKYATTPEEYSGTLPGNDTNKQIRITIDNLDTDYDQIELAYLYYQSATDLPDIQIFEELNVPESGSIEAILSGNEITLEVSIEEFSITSSLFTQVKTITSKDNRLVYGNIKSTKYSDLVFNARAYRFKDDGLGNPVSYVSDINVDPFDPLTSQVDKDAINPFNTDETNEYKWQTDLTTLGGEGPNIKYKFVKKRMYGDHKYADGIIPQPTIPPLIDSSVDLVETQTLVPNQTHNFNNLRKNYKSPEYDYLNKGYARGEIYRFGITLYDIYGRPGPVNWIADIRFPECVDVDNDDADEPSFKIAHNDRGGSTDHWLYALGIEFQVTIPSDLQSLTSAYSIVRVKREKSDRTKLGIGMLNPIYRTVDTVVPPPYNILPTDLNKTVGTNVDEQSEFIFEFNQPDIHFYESIDFNSGYKLRVVGVLPNPDVTSGFITNGSYSKFYENLDPTQAPYGIAAADLIYDLEYAKYVNIGEVVGVPNNTFWNYRAITVNTEEAGDVGNRTSILKVDDLQPMDWNALFLLGDAGGGLDDSGKVLASYERPVSDQYGGATEIDRRKNIYISTGHFYPMASSSPVTHTVFGGDVYIAFYGYTAWQKNDDALTESLYDVGIAVPIHQVQIFPVETTINVELRGGYHALNKYDPASNTYADSPVTNWQTFDQFYHNNVYSSENDFIQFIAYDPNVLNIEEFDSRIWLSNEKINGEEIDSWRVFLTSNYKDAESEFGPINNLLLFNNEVYFFQDKAFGGALINPIAQVQSNNANADITLGDGDVIQQIQYISKRLGCKHQWANTASAHAIYFLDFMRKKFIRFSSNGTEPISVIKGMDSWFRYNLNKNIGDNPLEYDGIHMAVNRNGEIYTTILIPDQNNFIGYNLVFSEMAGSFSSFYDLKTPLYLTDNVSLFSTKGSDIYICNKGLYGQFDGLYYPSVVVVSSNEGAAQTKTFDVAGWDTELYQNDSNLNETFEKIVCDTDYQTSGEVTMTPRRSEREWWTYVPRNVMIPGTTDITDISNHDSSQTFKERMRDKYLLLKLIKENGDDKRFVVNYVRTSFRPSQI